MGYLLEMIIRKIIQPHLRSKVAFFHFLVATDSCYIPSQVSIPKTEYWTEPWATKTILESFGHPNGPPTFTRVVSSPWTPIFLLSKSKVVRLVVVVQSYQEVKKCNHISEYCCGYEDFNVLAYHPQSRAYPQFWWWAVDEPSGTTARTLTKPCRE